ncbi:MAG: hypothetical protein AAF211_31655, partial [Myxococcota bacterium]
SLETTPPTGWDTPGSTAFGAVRRAVDVLSVVHNHAPSAQAFQQLYQDHPASWTAEIGESAWVAMLSGLTEDEVPNSATGSTLAERSANWARSLFRNAEQRYPSAAVRGDLLRFVGSGANPTFGTDDVGGLRTFLTDHRQTNWHTPNVSEDFHLGKTFAPQYFVDQSVDASVHDHVQRLQRLYTVAPRRDGWIAVVTLWKAGFESAIEVAAHSLDRLKQALEDAATLTPVTPTVPDKDAEEIHEQSTSTVHEMHGILCHYNPYYWTNFPWWNWNQPEPPPPPPEQEFGLRDGAAPAVASLFSQALCGCEHCGSVLSPAAYFVDMLVWLKSLDPDPSGQKHYDRLVELRPDLPHLRLDCGNTHTELPYADLVIEMMEEIIGGTGLSGLPSATTRPSEQLAVYPEHADRAVADAAYDELKLKFYPQPLPYDLPLHEMQVYLGHLGTSMNELFDRFGGITSSVPVPEAVAAVRLGGNSAALGALLDEVSGNDTRFERFASGNDGAWLEQSEFFSTATPDKVVDLLRELGTEQLDDVFDLLGTQYLNARGQLGVELLATLADDCDPEALYLRYDNG